MKILIVGSGGREHAIADALAQSEPAPQIYCAPGNGGIQQLATLVPIRADDVQTIVEFAANEKIDLTFVGPEVPLSKGIVDAFQARGLKVVGPTADQARLESSKSFAKKFFTANNIPTARFWQCSTLREALAVIDSSSIFPIVIKADGLAAGKGVIIAEDHEQARTAAAQLMESRILGDAGAKLVIEEFMVGEEASFHIFADRDAFQPMVAAQDHKRRFDNDLGPNTGGMGAYSVDTILSAAQQAEVIERIVRPTLLAAKAYSGILYVGLMMTSDGPKVVEYNCRFGDPETQVILPRLQTNLLEVLFDIADHRLQSRHLKWTSEVTASVVLVGSGYPGKTETGKEISGLDEAGRLDGVKIYHAGTYGEDGKGGKIFTDGGRVLNVTARAATLELALNRAYAACEMIRFEGKDYRKDIGQKGLLKKR